MNAQSFFYWGIIPLADEVQDDIMAGLMQGKRSLFYNREYGAGIRDYENAPNSASTMVMMKYEAVRFMAIRNGVVSDGSDGKVDRRAATSQAVVSVEKVGPDFDMTVPYWMLADLSRQKSVSIPIGGTR
jgi:hypothetical protein